MNRITLIFLSLFYLSFNTISQPTYTPTEENLQNRQWFQDAKFGMFIHWGIYSVLGQEEWVMENSRMDKKTYEKVASFFNPVAFNPSEWVQIAKSAGMKYITITSKHHDGFAMFDSKLTDWDIVDRSPYKRDVLKLLAEECKKEGIKLFFYYSQLDWYQNDYYPRGNTGHNAGRPDEGEWNKYLDFMNGQLSELLTNYGEIGGIWFDGWWDKKQADWQLEKTYKTIHDLQPACLIGSNHHQAPKPGEDFQMYEKDLPGHNTTGFSGEASVGNLPLETCETMNNHWGFALQDNRYKSVNDLVAYLVKAAGYNSNFLLNIGPMPNGQIQTEFADTLKSIGQWMGKYGETIYGTRGGPVPPQTWGVTTQKDKKIYVHILKWQSESFSLPPLPGKVKGIINFHNKDKIAYQVTKHGIIMHLNGLNADEPDRILEITLL